MTPQHSTSSGQTLADAFTLEGAGLFSAAPCQCTVRPNTDATGIIFKHNDAMIQATIEHLSSEPAHPVFATMPARCTAIGHANTTVWTIEHIMSAFVGAQIHHAIVELSGSEVPILDGSSKPFTDEIARVGRASVHAPIDPVVIHESIRVEHNDSFIEITPSGSTSYHYTIDYGRDAPISPTTVSWNADQDEYATRIAPSRTFCLEHEADAMHAAGLFAHLSTEDMLVLGDQGPINNTLRHPDEAALHKLLDLIGDLALVGQPIIGAVRAHKSGHALAHQAARAIVESIGS